MHFLVKKLRIFESYGVSAQTRDEEANFSQFLWTSFMDGP